MIRALLWGLVAGVLLALVAAAGLAWGRALVGLVTDPRTVREAFPVVYVPLAVGVWLAPALRRRRANTRTREGR